MTLKRQDTLCSSKDFSFVFEDAKKVFGQHTTVLFRKTDLGYPRLGLAISKKHTRTAIVRNKVRRIAKESFRAQSKELGSVDIIVLSKRGVEKIDAKVLRQSIESQWDALIKKLN